MTSAASPRLLAESAIEPATDDLAAARRHLRAVVQGPEDMERHRATIRAFLDEHPDALHRTCLDGHLTGSALILHHDRRRVALLFHSKLERWLQPGGHADGDGNLAHVALREAQEETGLRGLQVLVPAVDIDVHEIPARGDEPRHLHLDLRFMLLAPEGAELVGNHESRALRWFGPDEVGDLGLDEGLHRLIGRAFDAAAALSPG